MLKAWTLCLPLLLAGSVCARDAGAGDGAIAVGEIASPPIGAGIDSAALRASAEEAIHHIDVSKLPAKRFVVSLAVTHVTDEPIGCTVSATLRDGKSGTLTAIMEGRAAVDGRGNADLKERVAHAAVASAMRQIPTALGR